MEGVQGPAAGAGRVRALRGLTTGAGPGALRGLPVCAKLGQQDSYEQAAEAGLCPRCKKQPPLPGGKLCEGCRNKGYQTFLRRRARRLLNVG